MPEHGHDTCPHCDAGLSGSEPACSSCGGGLFGVAPKTSIVEGLKDVVKSTIENARPTLENTTDMMQSASESVGDVIERTTEMIGDTLVPVFTRSGAQPDLADAALLPGLNDVAAEVDLPFINRAREEMSSQPQTANERPPNPTNAVADGLAGLDAGELVSRGEALAGMGELESAMKAFNAAIATDPSHAMAWFDRGVVLEQTGLAEDATKSFQICLAHDSEHGPAHANLATILDRMGDPAAIEHAKMALKSFPGHSMLTSIAGTIESTIQSSPPSTQAMEQKAEQDTEPAELAWPESEPEIPAGEDAGLYGTQRGIEMVLGSGGSTDTDLQRKEQADDVKENSIDADELAENASQALRLGDAQAAYDILESHLTDAVASHPRCWRVAGGALAMLGRTDEAIEAFTESLNLDNEDPAGWFNLGMLHRRNGDIESASTCYSAALSLDEEHAKSAFALADARLKLGDIEGSLTAWRQLLTLQPDNPERILFAQMLIEIAEGESTILETHTELPPTLPEGPVLAREAKEVIDGMSGLECELLKARAHSICGEHTDSIVIIKKHLEGDKTNASIWDALATALISAGQNEKASKCRAKVATLRRESEGSSGNQSNGGSGIQSVETIPTKTSSSSTATATSTQTSTGSAHAPKQESDTSPESDSKIDNVQGVLQNDSATHIATNVGGQSADKTEGSASIEHVQSTDAAEDLWNEGPWNESSDPPSTDSPLESLTATSIHDHDMIENAEQVLESTPMPESKRRENQDTGVNLAKAALDVASLVSTFEPISADSSSVVNNSVEWYNKAIILLEGSSYKEALSCFDAALKGAAGDDDFAIRVLNGRGHALYYMEKYGDCIRAYHDAMRIDKTRVSGQSLYNMGTAYAEVQLFEDAIQCFKQAQRRGLSKQEKAMCKEQIRRCTELLKIEKKKIKA